MEKKMEEMNKGGGGKNLRATKENMLASYLS